MHTQHNLPTTRWIAGLLTLIGLLLTPALATAGTLPDNRAWEMVSPPQKNGGEVRGIDGIAEGGVVQAAAHGEAITYTSFSAFAEPQGAPFANQYLSTRGAGGWATQNLNPPTSQGEYILVGQGGPYKAFSADLSAGLVRGGKLPGVPGDFHVRDTQTGEYTPLVTSDPANAGGLGEIELIDASPDLKHILFSTAAALTPNSTFIEESERNEYEWSDGQLEAINILPGTPNNQTTPSSRELSAKEHEISSDGSTVFWSSLATGAPSLYVRENVGRPPSPLDSAGKCVVPADACSVQMDASPTAVEHSGEFQGASSDGSRAFFLDRERLTSDSTAGGRFGLSSDLYEFDVPRNELRDLTVDHNPEDPGGTAVHGVMGISRDGSYIYFVAGGSLPGALPNKTGQHPVSGMDNVYLDHEGTITYITKLTENDEEVGGGVSDWKADNVYYRTTRVSPDGKGLVFMAREDLTGQESNGFQEVYLYKAGDNDLVCVSCNPSGAAPEGPSKIPAGTGFKVQNSIYESRVLSADSSRVFFDSDDALVPQDTNNHQDVYEWEQEGAGTCTSASAGFSAGSGGCVSLISGGTYNADSSFVDADEEGKNVFFITGQQLVSQDTDELGDLYDARENGGLTPPPAPPVCSGTGCQGVPPAPPIFATPSTATFAGEGNLAPAAAKPTVKAKALTRAQKLAKVLKVCRTERGKRRSACEAAARKRYAPLGRVKGGRRS